MLYLNGNNNLFYKCDHTHTEISTPEAKLYSADIPLQDGALDLTNVISDNVFYGDRTISIGLELRALRSEWPMHLSHLINDIHGKEVHVEFDDDPRYYWIGRASVAATEDHGASCGIEITVTAKPFKRRLERTELYNDNVGGSDTINFTTTAPRTYFYFTVTGAAFTASLCYKRAFMAGASR